MRLLLTGGHLTPAYAFIQEINTHGDTVIYVGRTQSPEEPQVTALGATFYPLHTVKFDRYHKLRSLLRSPQLLRSTAAAVRLLKDTRPDAVISFGSYISVPVLLAAKLRGIKSVLHEQTTTVGLATRLSTPLVDAIAVSYSESLEALPVEKTVVTGNLVRRELYTAPQAPPWAHALTPKPLLYITGGNQGSAFLNLLVNSLAAPLKGHYQIVHQTGTASAHTTKAMPHIYRQPWFEPAEVSWLMHQSHLCITRSGANTIAELMVTGLPALCIPLPGGIRGEQLKNATYLQDHGAALLLQQSAAQPSKVLATIKRMEAEYPKYKHAAGALSNLHPQNAANRLYQLVYGIIHALPF